MFFILNRDVVEYMLMLNWYRDVRPRKLAFGQKFEHFG